MKTIYLRITNDWKKFEYENISELEKELTSRSIFITADSCVNDSYVGNGSTVNGSTVNGSRVLNGSTVDGSIVNGSIVDGSRVLNGSRVDGSRVLNGSTVDGSTMDGSRVLNGSTVDGSIVDGSRVDGSTVLNGEIKPYTALFAINLYKYTMSAYFNKKGEQIIQLGCYTRTRKDWQYDFWNNTSEFPNDGSDSSEARMRAFKMGCFFFDNLPKK